MRFLFIAVLLLAGPSWAGACPRIISQSPYITHQLDWLGLKSCIVGASRYERSIKAPDTGGVLDPDGAAIRRLAPDLLITSVWTAPEKLAAASRSIASAASPRAICTSISRRIRQPSRGCFYHEGSAWHLPNHGLRV